LFTEYRALIAQPEEADMKRCIDERWGEGCEANEDGAFPPLDQDFGGLLVLLPVSNLSAVVLPSV
jgi:hypothetical protein